MTRKMKFLSVLWIVILSVTTAKAQDQGEHPSPSLKDSVVVNRILQVCREKFGVDPAISLNLATQARDLSRKIGFRTGEATAIKYIGNANYLSKNPAEALSRWEEALKIFQDVGDRVGTADLLGNIGTFYYSRGENAKAIDQYLSSLKIAEQIGYNKAIISSLNNIGNIYYNNSATYDKALKYYLQALPYCQSANDNNSLGAISVNIGNIYMNKGDKDTAWSELEKASSYFLAAQQAYRDSPANLPQVYNSLGALWLKKEDTQKAYEFYTKAQRGAEKMDKLQYVKSLIGLGKIHLLKNDYVGAIAMLKQAEVVAREIDAVIDFEELYGSIAKAYAGRYDFPNAYKYQTLFTGLKDSLYNVEFDKKIATLQFDFELEKKEGQISLLKKDQALKAADLKQQRLVKNGFAAGLLLIIIIAVIIFRNYRQKVKVNKILDKQKDQIEHLLHNILPVEVASELKATGSSIPKSYERVSVLFTDFKGFTLIADKLSPENLVQELNQCFMAFDNIVEKHGLEKIKTIGDSYMCAGGIPREDPGHHLKIIRAALDIQRYIADNNARRRAEGLETWEIRIGVHVGPVVAGVVGRKKYAYDIWGSTVNIASRMESSGVPGQVNISAATFELIRDKYACIYRGKIHAKNIGEIDMYLVDHEIDTLVKLVKEETVKGRTNVIPG
ncbi:MAG: adenylate/guanylate cyclase domain-containing protein [Flavisolibacter sp.]